MYLLLFIYLFTKANKCFEVFPQRNTLKCFFSFSMVLGFLVVVVVFLLLY